MKGEIQANCAYDDCDNRGEAYNDGENFEKIHYDYLSTDTKCLACNRTF